MITRDELDYAAVATAIQAADPIVVKTFAESAHGSEWADVAKERGWDALVDVQRHLVVEICRSFERAARQVKRDEAVAALAKSFDDLQAKHVRAAARRDWPTTGKIEAATAAALGNTKASKAWMALVDYDAETVVLALDAHQSAE